MAFAGCRIAYAFILLLFAALDTPVHCNRKCVDVEGSVQCNKDSSRASSVLVTVYDQDGFNDFVRYFDPDDLMAETFTDEHGHFRLTGCASDFNWLWFPNYPDPQVRIRHNCNGHVSEIKLPTFYEFQPSHHYVGITILDDPEGDEPDNDEVMNKQMSNDRKALMSFLDKRSHRAVEHLNWHQKIGWDQPIDEYRGSGEEGNHLDGYFQ